LSAAELGFGNVLFAFGTPGRDLHSSLKKIEQRAGNLRAQNEILTGIGAADGGNRAGFAQPSRPGLSGGFEQAAFFLAASAKIIAVKVRAVVTSGGFHGVNYTCGLEQRENKKPPRRAVCG